MRPAYKSVQQPRPYVPISKRISATSIRAEKQEKHNNR